MKTSNEKKNTTPPRVFLFQGDDDYTTHQKARNWTEVFIKKYGPGSHVLVDAGDEDPAKLTATLRQAFVSQGLFSRERLVVVKSIFQQKADAMEPVTEMLEDLPDKVFLVLWEPGAVKKNLKLYKKLAEMEKKGQARIYDFEIPAGLRLNKFIEQYARDRGIKLAPAAVEKLGRTLGRDLQEKVKTAGGYGAKQVYNLWQVTSEIDKLGAYKNGGEITASDVERLVSAAVSDNVFLLTEALGRKDKKAASKCLDELLDASAAVPLAELKGKSLLILGALAGQFRSVLQLSAAKQSLGLPSEIASELGWSPYRVQVTARLLAYFSESQLRKILGELLAIDKKLKSTTLPPKVLLSQLIVSI